MTGPDDVSRTASATSSMTGASRTIMTAATNTSSSRLTARVAVLRQRTSRRGCVSCNRVTHSAGGMNSATAYRSTRSERLAPSDGCSIDRDSQRGVRSSQSAVLMMPGQSMSQGLVRGPNRRSPDCTGRPVQRPDSTTRSRADRNPCAYGGNLLSISPSRRKGRRRTPNPQRIEAERAG